MKIVKKRLLRVFFACEACMFLFFYLFGTQGLSAINKLSQHNTTLDTEIENLQSEIQSLEQELIAWRSDPFYQEKIARERLHMARKDELIFFVNN